MDNDALWKAVLGELELSLSKASFTTWFKHTFVYSHEDNTVIVGVPNAFTKAWLENKYHQDILKTMRKITDNILLVVRYDVVSIKEKTLNQATPAQSFKEAIKQVSNDSENTPQAPTTQQVPSHTSTNTVTRTPASKTGLNPNYTFQTFVVGKGNELAKAACMAVAKNPGFSYNPLFIYGGVGLGKTHLMQAIGNEIFSQNSNNRILYVTCEKFTNDFIRSVQEGRASQFKDTYRSVDLLLIDDIQFLAGKEGTQEEFFHTFNTLHQINKQIVISSDRPPKAIPSLEERLISRFEWGMIADVSAPDYETRMAILRTKCQEKGFNIGEDVLQFVADSIQNNIRELEGALNKLTAYAELQQMPLTLESTKNILSSITSSRTKNALTVKQLLQNVCNFFDISMEDILGNSRKKELVIPRQIAIYLLREELKSSYPTIGQELGGRDHTTAMHAYSKISKIIKTDDKIRQDIDMIKQQLYANK